MVQKNSPNDQNWHGQNAIERQKIDMAKKTVVNWLNHVMGYIHDQLVINDIISNIVEVIKSLLGPL